jgi:hypothetical protein
MVLTLKGKYIRMIILRENSEIKVFLFSDLIDDWYNIERAIDSKTSSSAEVILYIYNEQK